MSPNKFLLFMFFVNVCDCMFDEKEPKYLESKVGSWVLFDCNLEFPNEYPIPYHLHWKKDNNLIFAWYGHDQQTSQKYAGRIHLIDSQIGVGKASINLTSVRESDSGWYECKMVYPNRSPQVSRNGTWYHLSVDGSTLMKIPPVNQTVMEYSPAFFHCTVKNPETMFVTWYKNNELLSSYNDLASRTVMGADGSILITPTLMTDLGVYTCKVKNIEDQEESASAFLNVQYKAKVVYAPKEVFFAIGNQAMLDCHFRSNPPLTNLRWEKDGFLFDPYNVKDVFYKRNGSLYFSQVDDLHAGKYTCTPLNELGSDGPSSPIHVIVQHPPEFTLKPKTVYIQKLGDTVTLHCSAKDKHTDDDRSLITWSKKDAMTLPFHRHIVEGGNLTIFNLTANDRGVYTCSAINEAAKIETDTEIMIETFSPKAPSNLTATSTKDSITIRWIQNTIQPDLKFSVWYRLVDLQEWRTHQVRGNQKYEATIENLESGKEYEMMVLSQDSYNDGLFSKSFRYRTKAFDYQEPEEQASIAAFSQVGPPRNLSFDLNGDQVQLKWTDPEYGNEHLSIYVVKWFKEPEHKLQATWETRNNFYSVPENEIEGGVSYSFQVSSFSSNNYEAQSNIYEIPTPRGMITVVVATGAVILIMILSAVAVTLYLKRNLFTNYSRGDKI